MRLSLISDTHLDARTMGRSRFPEIKGAIGKWVEGSIRRRVDAACFLGDLFNPDSGPIVFKCLEVAIDAIARFEIEGIRSVWLRGNHDVIADGRVGGSVLGPLRNILAEACHVVEEPCTIDCGTFALHCLPFGDYDPDAVARGFVRSKPGVVDVVLTHLTKMVGVQEREESDEMRRGKAVEVPRRALGGVFGRLVPVFAGHWHKRQIFDPGDGLPAVHVVGSPARLRFDEEENDPAFLVVGDFQ